MIALTFGYDYPDRTVVINAEEIAAVEPTTVITQRNGSRIYLRSGKHIEVEKPASKVQELILNEIIRHGFAHRHKQLMADTK